MAKDTGHGVAQVFNSADVNLIALAPEMLDALKTLVESLKWAEKHQGTTYNGFETARDLLTRIEQGGK